MTNGDNNILLDEIREETSFRNLYNKITKKDQLPSDPEDISRYVAGGNGSKEDPFQPKPSAGIYLFAGILRDFSKKTGKQYYFKFNNQLYKSTGENKLTYVL